jgi:hypothetical protein
MSRPAGTADGFFVVELESGETLLVRIGALALTADNKPVAFREQDQDAASSEDVNP